MVHGVNGAGKTSLSTALNWSLYGLGADDIGELVSKRAIDEAVVGSDVEMQSATFTFQPARSIARTTTGSRALPASIAVRESSEGDSSVSIRSRRTKGAAAVQGCRCPHF